MTDLEDPITLEEQISFGIEFGVHALMRIYDSLLFLIELQREGAGQDLLASHTKNIYLYPPPVMEEE